MAKLSELLKDAGLSDDEIVTTMSAFDAKAAKAIEDATLRQSDYSRNLDKLNGNWKTANDEYVRMQTELGATKAEKDEAARKLAEAEAKLASAPAPIDPAQVLSPAVFQAEMAKLAAGQTAYLGEVMDIADEHQALFGKRISPNQLMKEATAAGKSPADYWNEKYQVEAKRTEVATAAQEARDTSIREEERKKVLAEYLNPGSRPLRDSDQPFYVPQNGGAEFKNPWDEIGPSAEETNLVSELAAAGR